MPYLLNPAARLFVGGSVDLTLRRLCACLLDGGVGDLGQHPAQIVTPVASGSQSHMLPGRALGGVCL